MRNFLFTRKFIEQDGYFATQEKSSNAASKLRYAFQTKIKEMKLDNKMKFIHPRATNLVAVESLDKSLTDSQAWDLFLENAKTYYKQGQGRHNKRAKLEGTATNSSHQQDTNSSAPSDLVIPVQSGTLQKPADSQQFDVSLTAPMPEIKQESFSEETTSLYKEEEKPSTSEMFEETDVKYAPVSTLDNAFSPSPPLEPFTLEELEAILLGPPQFPEFDLAFLDQPNALLFSDEQLKLDGQQILKDNQNRAEKQVSSPKLKAGGLA